MAVKTKSAARKKRHTRVRGKVSGTTETPRLNVFRSLKNMYVQIIDDTQSKTLVSVSTLEAEFKGKSGGNKEIAFAIGKLLAERAKAAGITKVVFDRGGYLYHGRVEQVAAGAREGGLEF
jgi:large subunit ribosomal protein L18